MLFAFICKDKPGHLNVRMDTRPAHLEHLNKLNGSLVIVEAADIEAAKALADADPYAKAGLFESVDVKPYNWVFNNPGA
ncbi:MAG: YciI family protein [Rhizobium oryzihabitans]